MSELTIASLKTHELDQAAGVVAKGFLDQPADHIKAVWKGDRNKIVKQNQRLFSLLLNDEGKEVYVVKDEQEIIAVYAIQHSRYRQMSFRQQARMLLPMLRAAGSNLPRLIHWHHQWSRIAPGGSYMHLSPMCVSPEAQGQGVGKLMLNHLCAILDRRGLGAYLETGKWANVLFYEKYGFTVQQETFVYTAKTWTMWREPRENKPL